MARTVACVVSKVVDLDFPFRPIHPRIQVVHFAHRKYENCFHRIKELTKGR